MRLALFGVLMIMICLVLRPEKRHLLHPFFLRCAPAVLHRIGMSINKLCCIHVCDFWAFCLPQSNREPDRCSHVGASVRGLGFGSQDLCLRDFFEGV